MVEIWLKKIILTVVIIKKLGVLEIGIQLYLITYFSYIEIKFAWRWTYKIWP